MPTLTVCRRPRRYQAGAISPLVVFVITVLAITAAGTVAVLKAWEDYQGKVRKQVEVDALKEENGRLKALNEELKAQREGRYDSKVQSTDADIILSLDQEVQRPEAPRLSELRSRNEIEHELSLRQQEKELSEELRTARDPEEVVRLKAEQAANVRALRKIEAARVRAITRNTLKDVGRR